jgi:hypothetical protein
MCQKLIVWNRNSETYFIYNSNKKKNKMPVNKFNQKSERNWREHTQIHGLEEAVSFEWSILLNEIYKFSAVPKKIAMSFFTELEKNHKVCIQPQRKTNSQNHLEQKMQSRRQCTTWEYAAKL